MRRMKKFLSLLLVLCMVFAMVPSFAAAEEAPTNVAVSYNDNDGTGETFYCVDATQGSDNPNTGVYTTMQAAVKAAYDAWKLKGSGTIKLYQDYNMTDTVSGNTSNSIVVEGGQSLVLDLNTKTLTNNTGYRTFGIAGEDASTSLTVMSGNLTANGGDGGSAYFMSHSGATMAGKILLKDMDVTYTGTKTRSINLNTSSDFHITLDGGSYNAGSGSAFGISSLSSATNIYLKGGVKVYTTNASPTSIGAGKVYLEDAEVYTKVAGSDVTGGYGIAKAGTDVTGKYILGDGNQQISAIKHSAEADNDGFYVHTIKPAYAVSIVSDENGSVIAKADWFNESGDKLYVVSEETVTLDVEAKIGYELEKLTVDGADVTAEVPNDTYTFQMPAKDVTVTATFKEAEIPSHTITVEPTENGTVTAAAGAFEGDNVTLTVAPDPDFVLKKLTVNGTDVTADVSNGTYTFQMSTTDVTVTATFERDAASRAFTPEVIDGIATVNGTTITLKTGRANTIKFTPNFDVNIVDHQYGQTYATSAPEPTDKTLELGIDEVTNALTPVYSFDTTQAGTYEYTFSISSNDPAEELLSQTFTVVVENSSNYFITVEPVQNATVNVVSEAAEGETVTLTVAANSGYALEKLTVDGADVTAEVSNDTYTFQMPAKDVTVTATFKQVNTKAVTYSDGTNTTEYYVSATADPDNRYYTSMEAAVEAALAQWVQTANPSTGVLGYGTVTLYDDYEMTKLIPATYATTNSIQVKAGQSLVLDLNEHELKSSASLRMFSLAGSDPSTYLEVKNGVLYSKSQYIVNIGSSSAVSTKGTIKFTDVDMTYDGTSTRSMVLSAGAECNIIFDGGKFNTTKYIGPSSTAEGKISRTNIYLQGGVEITYNGESFVRFGNYNECTLYLVDAVVKTTSDGTDAGYGIASGAKGTFVLGDGVVPSVIRHSAEADNDGLYTHTFYPLGSLEPSEFSVAKVGDIYYRMDELVEYVLGAKNGDVVTFIRNYSSTDETPVLKTTAAVTYDFNGYTVTADIEASASLSIKGGTIVLSKPIVLDDSAVLTVANNAVIDASTGTVAEGTGAIVLKEAKVKFKTDSTNPYGDLYVEGGDRTEETNGSITTWTYTPAGDLEKGDNVAMLVESGRYFKTLAEAVAAASGLISETVQLVTDASIEDALTISKNISIDLNGFKALMEISVTEGDVSIENGTVASADDNAITVAGGQVTIKDAIVSAAKDAVVINGSNANVMIIDSKLTGDAVGEDEGYALDIQAVASVSLDNVTIMTGASNKAPIYLDENVAYDIVKLNSGEVYIPKAYYEDDLKWAEGQDKIGAMVSVSRYAYSTDVVNAADDTSSKKDCYVATVAPLAAKIGNVEYATLSAAISAAKEMGSATVVVMRDIDLNDEFDPATADARLFDFDKSQTITIDFNGNTVYGISGNHTMFRVSDGGSVITFKNGIIHNHETSADGTISAAYGTVYLENMSIYAAMNCVIAPSTSTVEDVVLYINGGVYVSDGGTSVLSGGSGRSSNPEFHISGGAAFISKTTNYAGVYGVYSAYIFEDGYVYYTTSTSSTRLPIDQEHVTNIAGPNESSVKETGHMAPGVHLISTYDATYDGMSYKVNYYGKSNVASVGSVEYASLESALIAAAADGKNEAVVLLSNANIIDAAVLPEGETLDLAGKTLSFSGTGSLELGGAITTNGGSIDSIGHVAVMQGAIIDGQSYAKDALLYSALNLKAVSLSLNEYVDINLKYSETETADFNSIVVKANGEPLELAKTANGYNVYKIEDVEATEYDDAEWIIVEARNSNGVCVGMPAQVSVKEYAKKVVSDETNYGYSSDLGMTMTAMMQYAGVDVATEFAGRVHEVNADLGDEKETRNNDIIMTGDLSNGYEMTFTVNLDAGKTGTLTVKHTDIYGNEFMKDFAVSDTEGTATYALLHAADAKQIVTATLVVDGTEVSKLETTLASAGATTDMALVVSNYAEKLFSDN